MRRTDNGEGKSRTAIGQGDHAAAVLAPTGPGLTKLDDDDDGLGESKAADKPLAAPGVWRLAFNDGCRKSEVEAAGLGDSNEEDRGNGDRKAVAEDKAAVAVGDGKANERRGGWMR